MVKNLHRVSREGRNMEADGAEAKHQGHSPAFTLLLQKVEPFFKQNWKSTIHFDTSININQQQSTSINKSQHQSTTITNINQQQSTIVNIHQEQSTTTLDASHCPFCKSPHPRLSLHSTFVVKPFATQHK